MRKRSVAAVLFAVIASLAVAAVWIAVDQLRDIGQRIINDEGGCKP